MISNNETVKVTLGNSRPKRFISLIVAIGALVITGVAAGAVIKHEINIQAMQNQKAELLDMARIRDKVSKDLWKNQQHLQDQITAIQDLINPILARHEQLLQMMPIAMTQVADLKDQMSRDRYRLEDIRRAWRAKRVIPAIRDFINKTFPCEPHCRWTSGHPHFCHHYPEADMVHVNFDLPLTSKNHTVAQVFAFDIVKRNKTRMCFMKYTGPKIIVIMENCINPWAKGLLDERHDVYMMPTMIQCVSEASLYSDNHWEVDPSRCYDKIDPTATVQHRYSEGISYIYCYLNNITIFGITTPCPAFVFSMSKKISFYIGDTYNWTRQIVTGTSKIQYAPMFNDKINHRFSLKSTQFYAHLNPLENVGQELERLEELKENPNMESPSLTFVNSWKLWLIVVSIIILLGCFCNYCAFRQGQDSTGSSPIVTTVVPPSMPMNVYPSGTSSTPNIPVATAPPSPPKYVPRIPMPPFYAIIM